MNKLTFPMIDTKPIENMLASLGTGSSALLLLPILVIQIAGPETALPAEPRAPTPDASPIPLSTKEANSSRKPMREPKPGTIRESVYAVLKTNGTRRRKVLVEEVARLRGVAADRKLQGQVGAVLDNNWDSHIDRVGYGQYSWKAGNLTEAKNASH